MDIGSFGLYICLFVALYFEVFLLISFFEKKPAKKTAVLPRHYPTVSMLVPCYNEEKTLGGTIESLLALHYPKDKLEIVVIDDGSKDNTEKIAREYAARFPTQVRFLQKENGGKYTALNLGISESRGEIVGCLDADSFVAPDALVEAVKSFVEDPSVMATSPAMTVYKPKSILELMQHVEYTFGIFYRKMFDNLGAISVLPGPFSLYKRAVFEKIGVFRHAHNTEDMEIAFRMHQHGLRIVNAHTALVYTTVPKTVRALLKQRVRWSRGFLENVRDYKHMFLNPRYGNFGIFVLPFGFVAFFAGIYSAGFALYMFASTALNRALDFYASGVPLQLPHAPELTWFYLNTGTMLFVAATTVGLTLVAILLGGRIAQSRMSLKSLLTYFAFFGFLAPLWLLRAAYETALARKHTWR